MVGPAQWAVSCDNPPAHIPLAATERHADPLLSAPQRAGKDAGTDGEDGLLSPNDKTALRFVLRHLAMGLGAGALFGIAILAADLAGLRSLAMSSDSPWLVIFLLFFGLFITFGSVSLAANLMLLERGDQDTREDD